MTTYSEVDSKLIEPVELDSKSCLSNNDILKEYSFKKI